MTWKVDLHRHSIYSDELERTIGKQPYNQACRRATPRRILQNCETRGINEVAITDSNGDLFFQKILDKEFFGEEYIVEVLEGENLARVRNEETGRETYFLNGIEFHNNPNYSFGNGHLVVVGHKGSLMEQFENLNLDERVELARESKGLWFFPHPLSKIAYGVGEENVRKFYEKLNGEVIVEGFNSQFYGMLNKDNEKAKKLAEELKIPALANSDSNSAEILSYNELGISPGRWELENGNKNIKYLKNEILAKRFVTKEKLISPLSFFKDYVWEFGTRKFLKG
jgi:predicted metal-dependent phosphoesterase TrpH